MDVRGKLGSSSIGCGIPSAVTMQKVHLIEAASFGNRSGRAWQPEGRGINRLERGKISDMLHNVEWFIIVGRRPHEREH